MASNRQLDRQWYSTTAMHVITCFEGKQQTVISSFCYLCTIVAVIVVISLFLHCILSYSSIRLSSRKSVINSVFRRVLRGS